METATECVTWDDVVGQAQLTDNLQSAIRHNKISHAYLIQGEKLSGKRMIADIFARALQCTCGQAQEERQATLFDMGEGSAADKTDTGVRIRPCNQCRSCRQAMNGNHPDIIYVTHEKPNVISVDNIRQQVNGDIAIKPYSGAHKIYIVDEAEKMNVQAQNALLKTLEEPPEYAVILLLATRAEAMLPTILSRCVTLNTKPVPDDLIKRFLMRRVEIPDYRASVCASFARGNVGRAVELASNENFDHMKSSALGLLKHVWDMEINQIAAEVRQIAAEKFDTGDYLDLCFIWYRDVLLYKACSVRGENDHLVFREELADIANAARRYDYDAIERIIHSIDRARNRIAANVNFDLTMELMFLDMKEGAAL
ncbi:MAG: DNA polymerase III subunit delta [Lachnospiraceae bacterium]|nr:DNA polymerase III subunit delta [Lachnospiraceae bacterium]